MTTRRAHDGGCRRDAPRPRARHARSRPRREPARRLRDPLARTARSLAEGWHRGAGTAHAEVDALSKLAPGAAAGATAVVTLEPCNHTGRTGPCAVALIDAGIARVVYAVADPGDHSAGGAERLRDAGVEVDGRRARRRGRGAPRRLAVRRPRTGRPHVTVKWASSLDGRAAAADGIEPVDHRPGRARRRAPAPRRGRRDRGRHRHRARRRPVAHRARPRRRVLRRAARAGGVRRRPVPADAALSRHPHAPVFVEPAPTSPPISPTCSGAASARSSSRAAPRSRAPSSPPASSTNCSSTSRPRCSAAPGSPSATSASRPSPTPGASHFTAVERLGDDSARRSPGLERRTATSTSTEEELTCSPESSRSSARSRASSEPRRRAPHRARRRSRSRASKHGDSISVVGRVPHRRRLRRRVASPPT